MNLKIGWYCVYINKKPDMIVQVFCRNPELLATPFCVNFYTMQMEYVKTGFVENLTDALYIGDTVDVED